MHDPAESSDEALLVGIAGGDREALAALFARYAGKVKTYLKRLGALDATAEDLAQDTMVSVWRSAASFDPNKAKASTWIFVIARNAWIDRLRRERVELAYRNSVTPAEDSTAETPQDSALRALEADQVRAALGALSDDQKLVVQLSFFEDRPHSEIAAQLALPLGTIKSRLRLALTKLRTHWEKQS